MADFFSKDVFEELFSSFTRHAKSLCDDCKGRFKDSELTSLKNKKTNHIAHLCIVCLVRWQAKFRKKP